MCYYYGLKPCEFWSCTFREINTYIRANTVRNLDDTRILINICEALGNKMIKANALNSKHPKNISLLDTFKKIFEKNV